MITTCFRTAELNQSCALHLTLALGKLDQRQDGVNPAVDEICFCAYSKQHEANPQWFEECDTLTWGQNHRDGVYTICLPRLEEHPIRIRPFSVEIRTVLDLLKTYYPFQKIKQVRQDALRIALPESMDSHEKQAMNLLFQASELDPANVAPLRSFLKVHQIVPLGRVLDDDRNIYVVRAL